MAMSTGADGLKNEPNMTPMIDVLLVLLIIFMMIIPMGRKAIDVQIPDPTPQKLPPNVINNQIVLEVMPGPVYMINKSVVAKEGLYARIKDIYAQRPEKIMFIKGDPAARFQDVIFGMDVARGGGVKVLGAVPRGPGK